MLCLNKSTLGGYRSIDQNSERAVRFHQPDNLYDIDISYNQTINYQPFRDM